MGKHKAARGEILTVAGPWHDLLLVCRKCSRKLDGGFGPEGTDTLPRAVKHALREAGRAEPAHRGHGNGNIDRHLKPSALHGRTGLAGGSAGPRP